LTDHLNLLQGDRYLQVLRGKSRNILRAHYKSFSFNQWGFYIFHPADSSTCPKWTVDHWDSRNQTI